MGASKQLTIPNAALMDDKSLEIARLWVIENAAHVSLRVGIWEDPGTWGIMLADLARHVANAYAQDEGLDREETLGRIRTVLAAEMKSPTDNPTGTVLNM